MDISWDGTAYQALQGILSDSQDQMEDEENEAEEELPMIDLQESPVIDSTSILTVSRFNHIYIYINMYNHKYNI